MRCQRLTDHQLVQFAETADEVKVHETGANSLPTSELARLLAPLKVMAWPHKDLISNPDALRRAMVRKLGENRSRLRQRTGKQLLAGVLAVATDGVTRTTLVLILAHRGVQTCDWQLT